MRQLLTNTVIVVLLACQSAGPSRDFKASESAGESEKATDDALQLMDSDTPGPNPETAAAPGSYPLGKLQDASIEQLLYDALTRRMNRSKPIQGEMSETRELGERNSFEFSIIKSMRDGVETEGQEVPNELEIEVRGWYRRNRATSQTTQDTALCASFDTVATVVYAQEKWNLGDNQQFVFTREDDEDCY